MVHLACVSWEGHRAGERGWLNHRACGSGNLIGGLTYEERGGGSSSSVGGQRLGLLGVACRYWCPKECQLRTKLLCTQLTKAFVAVIVIDSATYLLTISSPDINKVAMSFYDNINP